MKTPDEIKKGLECCNGKGCCDACPYDLNANDGKLCDGQPGTDALAYIQQLEAERDAAVRDMTNMAKEYGEPMCEYCGADSDAECRPCYMHNEGFRWRGLCKENTKEE